MTSNGWDGSGGHRYRSEMSVEEATKAALARNREWAQQPEVIEQKALRAEGERRRAQMAAKRKDQEALLIGPPNPFKPHRRGSER